MIRLDHMPDEAPHACHFLKAITGFLGGGGSSSSTSVQNSTTTNVDVQVNPQIGVGVEVDLDPVAQLGADIAAGGAAQAETLGAALAGQGEAFREGLSAIADKLGGALIVVALAGAAVVMLGRR